MGKEMRVCEQRWLGTETLVRGDEESNRESETRVLRGDFSERGRLRWVVEVACLLVVDGLLSGVWAGGHCIPSRQDRALVQLGGTTPGLAA